MVIHQDLLCMAGVYRKEGIVGSSRQRLGQEPIQCSVSAGLSSQRRFVRLGFFIRDLQQGMLWFCIFPAWFAESPQEEDIFLLTSRMHVIVHCITLCITSNRSKCASVSSLISSTVAAAHMIQQGRQKDIGLCKYININETLVCVFCPSCIMVTEIFEP